MDNAWRNSSSSSDTSPTSVNNETEIPNSSSDHNYNPFAISSATEDSNSSQIISQHSTLAVTAEISNRLSTISTSSESSSATASEASVDDKYLTLKSQVSVIRDDESQSAGALHAEEAPIPAEMENPESPAQNFKTPNSLNAPVNLSTVLEEGSCSTVSTVSKSATIPKQQLNESASSALPLESPSFVVVVDKDHPHASPNVPSSSSSLAPRSSTNVHSSSSLAPPLKLFSNSKENSRWKISEKSFRLFSFLWVLLLLIWVSVLIISLGLKYLIREPQFSGVSFNYNLNLSLLKPVLSDGISSFDTFFNARVLTKLSNSLFNSDDEDSPILDAQKTVDWAISSGYTSIVIADYGTVEGANMATKYISDNMLNISVIIGYSVSTNFGDLVAIGINDTSKMPTNCISNTNCTLSDDEISIFIKGVKQQGGIVSVNLKGNAVSSTTFLSHLADLGIDAVELVSQNVADFQALPFVSSKRLAGLVSCFPTLRNLFTPFAWSVLKTNSSRSSAVEIFQQISVRNLNILVDSKGSLMTGNPVNVIPYPGIPFQLFAPISGLSNWIEAFFYFSNTSAVPSIIPFAVFAFFLWYTLVVSVSVFLYQRFGRRQDDKN